MHYQQPINVTTTKLLVSVFKYLSIKRKVQLVQLGILMIFSASAEVISLGSVIPFLDALTNPARLLVHPFINVFANYFGIVNTAGLIVAASLIFAVTVIFAAVMRLANLWFNVRLAALIGSDLSCGAYRRVLYQSYEDYIISNSSNVITSTTIHTSGTAAALATSLNLATAAFVSIFLIIGITFINWKIAILSACLFGSVYVFLTLKVGKEIESNGHKVAAAAKLQIKCIQEGLGAFRDVVLDSSQETYVEAYKNADLPQRLYQAKNQFLGGFPRYAVESLGLILVACLGGLLALTQQESVISLLGAFALGAQRLLPALQQIYSSWALLRSYNADMLGVLELLKKEIPDQSFSPKVYSFHSSIRLNDVTYQYGSNSAYILNGVNLVLNKGERIGFVGKTGTGKSTVVDLLMSLLIPTSGSLLVDGVDIHDSLYPQRLNSWRSSISHVPQNIYLSDATIAENIAFGVACSEIDMKRVEKAAAAAKIAKYIESIPDSYNSFVGERGIRLSGGQRQRIGIARALYKQNDILVLDEATSALDSNTEKEVMDSIDSLNANITIIMIAHRLTTLKTCDRILLLENGSISELNYSDLDAI